MPTAPAFLMVSPLCCPWHWCQRWFCLLLPRLTSLWVSLLCPCGVLPANSSLFVSKHVGESRARRAQHREPLGTKAALVQGLCLLRRRKEAASCQNLPHSSQFVPCSSSSRSVLSPCAVWGAFVLLCPSKSSPFPSYSTRTHPGMVFVH